MKFIIEYGIDRHSECIAVEAKDKEDALDYAEGQALEIHESYRGDYYDFCDANELDMDDEDNWEEYFGAVQAEIFYSVHEFDETCEEDLEVLRECDNQFFEV